MALQSGDNQGTRTMTLAELLGRIDELDDDWTIYACDTPRWSASSRSVAYSEPSDGSVPAEAHGLRYLLEVRLAKEAIRIWSEWRANSTPSPQDTCEAVIYYATNDSYLPV